MSGILRSVALAAFAVAGALTAAERPNIVLIFADDLGLDGVSCHGSDQHRTPAIDKLATAGMRFETCYAAPLCGPSRCLLMTGRYAFRTGGLTNQSWRPNGPGAVARDENPVARLLKQAGYATGMAGKWRQVGETPRDWGFDEYLTDPTAGGWFWQNKLLKNGKQITTPAGTYAPDKVHEFAIDFLRRHKDRAFFFYYAMHHVHGPIQRTPDSAADSTSADALYQDNIHYMDKQVGAVAAELDRLGLREKTLVIFTSDNGTALTFPSTVGGCMLNGKKGSMLEGGSRVPFIACWPGTVPAGKVCKDIISLVDVHATCVDLAGAKPPGEMKFDGRSFAPQLRGEAGDPREWAYVQLGNKWFVRNAGFKLDQSGGLFDMSDAPFFEKPVAADADTEASRAARKRLTEVLAELNPAAGKSDTGGRARAMPGRRRKARQQP